MRTSTVFVNSVTFFINFPLGFFHDKAGVGAPSAVHVNFTVCPIQDWDVTEVTVFTVGASVKYNHAFDQRLGMLLIKNKMYCSLSFFRFYPDRDLHFSFCPIIFRFFIFKSREENEESFPMCVTALYQLRWKKVTVKKWKKQTTASRYLTNESEWKCKKKLKINN